MISTSIKFQSFHLQFSFTQEPIPFALKGDSKHNFCAWQILLFQNVQPPVILFVWEIVSLSHSLIYLNLLFQINTYARMFVENHGLSVLLRLLEDQTDQYVIQCIAGILCNLSQDPTLLDDIVSTGEFFILLDCFTGEIFIFSDCFTGEIVFLSDCYTGEIFILSYSFYRLVFIVSVHLIQLFFLFFCIAMISCISLHASLPI